MLYEAYYSLILGYKNIKIWRLLTYYFNNKAGKRNLSNKKRKAILIRYRENNYIYKVWDIKLRKAPFIRDIVIFKNIFKFHENNNNILKLILFIL